MKKSMAVVALAVAVLMIVSSALADDDISIDNRNTNTLTSNTTVTTNADANATGGNVDFRNSYIVPIQPYNVNAPAPIQSGPELRIGEWGLWLPIFFMTASYEQALSLSESYYGFFVSNRIGDEAIMMKGLQPTNSVTIVKYWGRASGDEYVASFPIYGKKRDNLQGLIGIALRRAMELGATKVGIMVRTIKEINTKGLSIGTGVGAGLYVPCNGSVGTGVNFGAYISNSKTEDMYELHVVCLRGGFEIVEAVSPPASPPKEEAKPAPPVECPKPTVCDPQQFLLQIKIWQEACLHCKKPCFNNEKLRKCMGDTYLDLYHCTGDRKYLVLAIKQYDIALDDFNRGHEPDGVRTKKMKGAKIIASMARYNESWAIRELHGRKAQFDFVRKNGINAVPSNYEELKR